MSDDIARAIPTIISESDYITTIAQGCSHAQLQSLRMKKIVRVQEHHKLPRDYLHTRISCRRKPSVLLAHDPKPLVFRSKIQSNRARRVRAAVIDKDSFPLIVRLGDETLQRTSQIPLHIKYWDNDADQTIHTSSPSVVRPKPQFRLASDCNLKHTPI